MATKDEIRSQFDALNDLMYQQLGPSKMLFGRRTIRKALRIYVTEWPAFAMEKPERRAETVRDMVDYGMHRIKGSDGKRYGFIWSILLSAVLSQLVSSLLKWWLERRENQDSMMEMRTIRLDGIAE